MPHDWVNVHVDGEANARTVVKQCARCRLVAVVYESGERAAIDYYPQHIRAPQDCPRGDMTEERASEIAQLRADLAAVRGACALALRWLGDPDDPNGTFEDIGAWYQRETGRLRPGKSLPMAMAGDSQEEREKHFRAWADAKDREVRAALKSAGGASRTERGDHAKGGG